MDIVFPAEGKLAAQSAKLGKPVAEIATGKLALPFNALLKMVLSHASEDADEAESGSGSAKSLVDNLKSMLSKPKAKAA